MAHPDYYVAMYTFGGNRSDATAKIAANLTDEVFPALRARLKASGARFTVGLLDGDHNFGYSKKEIDEMSPATVRKLFEQDQRVILSLFLVLNTEDGKELAFDPDELEHAMEAWQKDSGRTTPLAEAKERKAFTKFTHKEEDGEHLLDPAYFAYARLLLHPRKGTAMAIVNVEMPSEGATIDGLIATFQELKIHEAQPETVALQGTIILGEEAYPMRRLLPMLGHRRRLFIPSEDAPGKARQRELCDINTKTLDSLAKLIVATRSSSSTGFGCAYCGGAPRNAFGCPYCGGHKQDVKELLFKE